MGGELKKVWKNEDAEDECGYKKKDLKNEDDVDGCGE